MRINVVGVTHGDTYQSEKNDVNGSSESPQGFEEKEAMRSNNIEAPTKFTECPLWIALRPFLFSMALFGLYVSPEVRKCQCRHYQKWRQVCKYYCVFVVCLLSFNAVRLCTLYTGKEDYGSELFMKITLHSWSMQVAVQAYNCYSAFTTPELVATLFRKWSKAIEHDSLIGKYIKKRIMVYTIINWIFLLSISAFNMYGLLNGMDYNLLAPHPHYVVFSPPVLRLVTALQAIMNFFAFSSWIFPPTFLLIVTSNIARAFENFNEDLKGEIERDKTLRGRLSALRERHQNICEMADTADDIFKQMAGVILSMASLHTILILYNVLTERELPVDVMITYSLWGLMELTSVVVLCIGAGKINHQAHDCRKLLYGVKLTNDDHNMCRELQVFLSRLEGSPIGLSVMDMFVIDKPTIITLLGALLTYFTLLLTFQTSSSSCPALNNTLSCPLNSSAAANNISIMSMG